MGADEQARTVVLHLGPGDCIGEHPAESRQLMLVVRGRGWVSGSDGAPVPIGEDWAALFEPGEMHAAGTEVGMTLVVVEGEFSTP